MAVNKWIMKILNETGDAPNYLRLEGIAKRHDSTMEEAKDEYLTLKREMCELMKNANVYKQDYISIIEQAEGKLPRMRELKVIYDKAKIKKEIAVDQQIEIERSIK